MIQKEVPRTDLNQFLIMEQFLKATYCDYFGEIVLAWDYTLLWYIHIKMQPTLINVTLFSAAGVLGVFGVGFILPFEHEIKYTIQYIQNAFYITFRIYRYSYFDFQRKCLKQI